MQAGMKHEVRQLLQPLLLRVPAAPGGCGLSIDADGSGSRKPRRLPSANATAAAAVNERDRPPVDVDQASASSCQSPALKQVGRVTKVRAQQRNCMGPA